MFAEKNLIQINSQCKYILDSIEKGESPEKMGLYFIAALLEKRKRVKIFKFLSRTGAAKTIHDVNNFIHELDFSFEKEGDKLNVVFSKDHKVVFCPKNIEYYMKKYLKITPDMYFYPLFRVYFVNAPFLELFFLYDSYVKGKNERK